MTFFLRKPLVLSAICLTIFFYPKFLFSQEDDYLVTTKGETFYGKVKYENGGFAFETFATVKVEKGKENKFSIEEVQFFFKDGLRFEPKPNKPDEKKYFLFFQPLIMQNENVQIFLGGQPPSGSGFYGPVNSYLYYLYEDDKFKLEITRKNYREVIPTYFPECQALLDELNSKRNYFDYCELASLSLFHKKNCREEE